MGRLWTLGLMLVAMLVISASASATAGALQWLLNGTAVSSAVSVASKSSLEISDSAASGGALAVACEGTDKGTVGPGDRGEVTEIKESECEFHEGEDGACEASREVTAAALNLPWLSLVLSVELLTVDRLTAEGGKAPGWSVTCTVAGILKVADECTSSSIEPEVENETSGVGLLYAGEASSCSAGTRTSGMVVGPDLIENPTGRSLAVQQLFTPPHLEYTDNSNPMVVSRANGFTTTLRYILGTFGGPANTAEIRLFFNGPGDFRNNGSTCERGMITSAQTCTVIISCATVGGDGFVMAVPRAHIVLAERALRCNA
jgi:hypothetical protein